MELWFNPNVAVTTSHTLNLFIPVKSPELLDLYDIDMKTGLADGGSIFCFYRNTKVDLNCKLYLGNKATN
jgi:hypothetical protein